MNIPRKMAGFDRKIYRNVIRLRSRLGIFASVLGSCAVGLYFFENSVKAADREIDLPGYPWEFDRVLKSLDHSTIRRGWQVYRTVCYTCHSLRYVRFMDLIDVSHTLDEVKTIAAEFEVKDDPDSEGNYKMRAGKPSDLIPSPYPNEEAARAANAGANPPDLTYIIHARSNGTNYLFSLLSGWMEPPAGMNLEDRQYFNLYFPGNFTGMGQMLTDGLLEYEDGTPPTQSQMAKDVTEFLYWTASQEHDHRKLIGIKVTGISLLFLASVFYIHRRNWSHLRNRQIVYIPGNRT